MATHAFFSDSKGWVNRQKHECHAQARSYVGGKIRNIVC